MKSHEKACILNAGDQDAHVSITVFFVDKEAAGPYEVIVPARRTNHVNDLEQPQSIPPGTNFSSVIESDLPVVVQHTRLDSRQNANALLNPIAYPGGD
jgi:hypothetical protein